MSVDASPTIRRRQLGRDLRAAREAKNLSREQVAAELEISVSAVTRYETGRGSLRLKDLRQLLDFLGIADQKTRDELERLRAEGKQRGWWSGHACALKPSYQTLIGLEQEASEFHEFATVVVPGLIQTEQYARAIMQAALPQLDEDVIDARVAVRMQRQELITRASNPLRLHVVLDEGCIQRRVGGPDIWYSQMKHLTEIAELRNVTVQVVPFQVGAFASVLGGFTILRFDSSPDVAYVELTAGDVFAEGPDAERYRLHFEALRTVALPPTLSVALIREAASHRQGSS